MHDECKMLLVNQAKRCKKCKKVKAASSFSRDASRLEGRFPYCMPCQATAQDKFQNAEDELNGFICPLDDVPIRGHKNRRFCSASCKDRVASLRTKYGMTVEDYRRLREDAGERCPICLERPTVWQLDHNHKTRLAAGVVCIKCNVGLLAYSGHDIAVVERLLDYLKNTPTQKLGIEAFAPEEPEGKKKSWSNPRFNPMRGVYRA